MNLASLSLLIFRKNILVNTNTPNNNSTNIMNARRYRIMLMTVITVVPAISTNSIHFTIFEPTENFNTTKKAFTANDQKKSIQTIAISSFLFIPTNPAIRNKGTEISIIIFHRYFTTIFFTLFWRIYREMQLLSKYF